MNGRLTFYSDRDYSTPRVHQRLFHQNGQLAAEGIIDPQRTGPWRFYDEAGALLREEMWSAGSIVVDALVREPEARSAPLSQAASTSGLRSRASVRVSCSQSPKCISRRSVHRSTAPPVAAAMASAVARARSRGLE